VSWNQSSFTNFRIQVRHSRGSGNPEAFDFPGFRVALAIASLPGMTIELCDELQKQHTSKGDQKETLTCNRESSEKGCSFFIGSVLFAATFDHDMLTDSFKSSVP
jgi:hypothetical protein